MIGVTSRKLTIQSCCGRPFMPRWCVGSKVEGKVVLDDFLLRHSKYEISDISQRLGGADPRVVESRDRLIASLHEIGMR